VLDVSCALADGLKMLLNMSSSTTVRSGLQRIFDQHFKSHRLFLSSTLGLPLESVMPYSADYLLLISEQVAGNSDELEYVDRSLYRIVAMRNLTFGFQLF
jgi:hypothetical protein